MTMLKVGPLENRRNSAQLVVWDTKGQANITQIYVSHGKDKVNSLQFQYIDDNADLVLSPVFGCPHLVAPNFDTVTFKDSCKEYITRVSGVIVSGTVDGGLKSLSIETNAATYGPFGFTKNIFGAESFNYCLGPDNHFGGFHGKSTSSFISSIGVYVRPIRQPVPISEISAQAHHLHDDDQLPIK